MNVPRTIADISVLHALSPEFVTKLLSYVHNT